MEDDPFEEGPQLHREAREPRRARRGEPSKYEQRYGVSRGDLWREHFHTGGSWREIALGVVLFLIVAIIFIARYGTNPSDVISRVKSELGVPAAAVQGEVTLAHSPYDISLRILEGNGSVSSGNAHIIGLVPVPGRCGASATGHLLRPGEAVSVTFSGALGQKDSHGNYLVELSAGGQDTGEALLEQGGALIQASGAKEAGLLGRYQQAEGRGHAAHAGYWSCHH
jgi:hypothetical protein